jgi:hypothetical protein
MKYRKAARMITLQDRLYFITLWRESEMKIKIYNVLKSGLSTLLIVSLLLTSYGFAVAGSGDSGKDTTYRNGRIWKTDGYKIGFSRIVIGENSIVYKAKDTDIDQTIGIDQVMKVDVEKGSYALEYGVGVAIPVLIGSAVGVSTSNTNGIEPSSSVKNGIIIGMTAVGGLIGAVIGSTHKKYETVYSGAESSPESSIRLIPEIGYTTKTIGLRLTYIF